MILFLMSSSLAPRLENTLKAALFISLLWAALTSSFLVSRASWVRDMPGTVLTSGSYLRNEATVLTRWLEMAAVLWRSALICQKDT